MLLKITLFGVFGVMQCVTWFEVQKTHYFCTYCTLLLLLYATPFWNALTFTKLIILRSESCSDWPAIQCVVIGRIPQAWDGNVIIPLTYCDACPGKTRPITNEPFVASTWDIITDCKQHHVCICDRRNAKQALLYTAKNVCLIRQYQIFWISKRTYILWVRSTRLFLQSWNCSTL